MNAFLRLAHALGSMLYSAAFFGQPHRWLPERLRLRSFTFVALSSLFVCAGLLRHVAVAGGNLDRHTVALALYLTLLIGFAGRAHSVLLALVLAVSIGVDLAVGVFGLLGLDISAPFIRFVVFAWQVSACASVMRHYAHSRMPAAPDEEFNVPK